MKYSNKLGMSKKANFDTAFRPAKISRRKFVASSAIAAGAIGAGAYSFASKSDAKGRIIIIIGGGAAGVSAAARLARILPNAQITLVDPSVRHFYQPGFTLIASGVYNPDEVYKPQADCIPSGVKWLKDSVAAVDAQKKTVRTLSNGELAYDFLVLTPGLVCRWDLVEGIDENSLGTGDAHCIYSYEGAIKTWQGVQKFVKDGGKGVFTDTYTKHKCGGAPKKICLLTEHLARKQNRRNALDFNFFTASKELYDVPFFTPRLLEIYKERNIPINTRTRVKSIDTSAKKVVLEKTIKSVVKSADSKEETKTEIKSVSEDYDFLHFLPPMTAPKFVTDSGLSKPDGDRAWEGWVWVDKNTLVHKKYPNIISFGDVASIPTSKTSAAIRKQTPVAVANLVALMEGRAPEARYDGYAACPIVTDYGHVLLCEFDYNKEPKISFPFNVLLDMSKEQHAAWLLKVYGLKPMYFYGMLNGLA